MKIDDLKFTVKDINDKDIECSIVSLMPINDIESYVLFLDDTYDINGDVILKYGKLIQNEDGYELKGAIMPEELVYIKEKFDLDFIKACTVALEDRM